MGRNFVRGSTRIDLGSTPVQHILCDLFLTTEGNYFRNFADDTTPYVIGNNDEEYQTKSNY